MKFEFGSILRSILLGLAILLLIFYETSNNYSLSCSNRLTEVCYNGYAYLATNDRTNSKVKAITQILEYDENNNIRLKQCTPEMKSLDVIK